MSERLYRCLLYLYPSKFREDYGEAALQLFLDRSRDEQGIFLRARFWLDLLIDLFISVPGEYRRSCSPKLVTTTSNGLQNGYGVFGFVGRRSLPLRWIFAGALVSLFSFFLLLFFTSYRTQGEWRGSSGVPMQTADLWRSFVPRQFIPQHLSDDSEVIVLGKDPFRGHEHSAVGAVKPGIELWSLLIMRIHSEPIRSKDRDWPAAEAFWNWFDAFNGGDQKTLEAYLGKVELRDSVDSELRLRTLTGGFRLQAVINSEREFIRVLLRDKKSWTRYLVSVRTAAGAESPRVVGLHLTQIARGSDIEEVDTDPTYEHHVANGVVGGDASRINVGTAELRK